MGPPRCFVHGCESYKNEEKISMFSVPRDPSLRKIWNDILKHPTKNLESSHLVCEKHFDTNDILKCLQVNEITLPNKKPRLRKGCMPLPFSKPRNLEVDETEYETKFDMTLTDTKIMPEFIQPKCIKPESINIVNDANLKNSFKMEEFTDFIGIKEEANAACSNFFNELFENKYIFGLTEYWGIHSCESWMPPQKPCMVFLVDKRKPKTIIFSQVNTREGFPVFEKQVVINEQLEIRYFVGHTMVYNMCLPQQCSTLEELCNAVNKYSEFVLCRVEPSCEEYKITLPNKIPRLRKGCMPVPFSKPRNLEVDETEYDTKFDMTLTDTKIMPEFIQPKFIKPESINIVNDANLKNPFKMEEFTDLIGIKEETNAAHSNFFNELFENKYIFDLTEYWGIHSCESWMPPQRPCMVFLVDKRKPKTIIFLQVNTREGFPVFEKHVVINEQLEIRYFVGHTMVYNMCLPQLCSTLEELCNAVNKYSEFVLCRGGPSCEEYKEIIHITNCAYQDVSSRAWRHKNCNFFTQGNMQPCLFCQALPKYFKTILKKSKKLKNLREKMESNAEHWPDTILKKISSKRPKLD